MRGKRLAVLEFTGSGDVKVAVLRLLSDRVRAGVLDSVRRSHLAVMTRESMLAVLRDMGKQNCQEGECEVETARNIGADFVVSGEVLFLNHTYLVTLKLHETAKGNLLSTLSARGKNELELVDQLQTAAAELAMQGLGSNEN